MTKVEQDIQEYLSFLDRYFLPRQAFRRFSLPKRKLDASDGPEVSLAFSPPTSVVGSGRPG